MRREGKLLLKETPIKLINIDNIHVFSSKKSSNVISFSDGVYNYRYNLSKNVLYQSFEVNGECSFDVEVLEEPFQLLSDFMQSLQGLATTINPIVGTVCLPLYSVEKGKKLVYEKSGINQWNAGGRKRSFDEVYLKIPSWIHKSFKGFFPSKETAFSLGLPDGSEIIAKVCQDNDKAIMSNPNSALGDWLLRSVLQFRPGSGPITYEHLENMGIDSVEINKFKDGTYNIFFKKLGAYENFMNRFM
jgi:hypothetical protein